MSGKSRRSRKRSSPTPPSAHSAPDRSPADASDQRAGNPSSRVQSDENTDELFARTSGELVRFAREKRRIQRHWGRPAVIIGLVTAAVVAGLLLYGMSLGPR